MPIPKLHTSTGQFYHPGKEYFYSIALLVIAIEALIQILISLAQVVGITNLEISFLFDLLKVFSVTFTAVLLIHMILKKFWFAFITISVTFAVIVIQAEAVHLAIFRNGDFSAVFLIQKIRFWCIIGISLSFIYEDKGRFSWLLLAGLSLAASQVLGLFAPETPNLIYLFFSNLLNTLPTCFLFLEIWNSWEKKKPFWFLRNK